MADSDRTATHPVGDTGSRPTPRDEAFHRQLADEPYRFGFYSVLRRLEAQNADRPRLGASVRPSEDAIRLRQEPSMAFAPSVLASYKRSNERGALAVYFLGLFGPNGPLPHHLTEYARSRARNENDPTFARFADIFHHRLLSLFYRAWADSQPVVHLDRQGKDRFATYVGSLFGFCFPGQLGLDAVPNISRLHYAGLLGTQTRPAEGLESLLHDYFDIPTRIETFVGTWVEIPEENHWGLGSPEGILGQGAVIGERVWLVDQKFRIVFGPMSFADYQRLLPGQDSLKRLVGLVRSYVGFEFDWDVRLIVKKEEVSPLTLGSTGQLGWTSWAASSKRTEDPGDLVFDPSAAA